MLDVKPSSTPEFPKKLSLLQTSSKKAALSPRTVDASIPALMLSHFHSLKAWAPEEEKIPLDIPSITFFSS